MTLCLRNIGIATAYATVGVGEVHSEMESAVEAVNRLRSDAQAAKTLGAPETIFLLGQADVATIFETSNFKRVFDLHYPRAKSHAAVVNWVFSVPYDLGREESSRSGSQMRFILHLRLRRSVYAFPKIEDQFVEKLLDLLGKHRKDARIHVGLGWSDLLIDGYFSPRTFKDLARFIIEVHGVKMRYGAKEEKKLLPVLQRMLTVIGYTGEPPRFPGNRHLTFLRAKPGEYNKVEAILRKYGSVYALDGKADFMVTTSKSRAKPDWLSKQRELGDGRYADSVRKVETHLMMFPAEDFRGAAAAEKLYIESDLEFDRDKCGCKSASDTLVGEVVTTMDDLRKRKLLPTEQRYAVDNTLFLLEATLRDASVCCDTRDAVLSSYDGLLKILRAIDNADNQLSAQPPAYRYQQTVSLWRRLDEWHRFTELLLRQRTVGSYEEILGQSDRSVVYSGGVQKFLYLADNLIADFARRVGGENPPRFATLYDSVKTILSFRTGVVRVPTSKIFSFPLVVADLWHEVAGSLFFLRYGQQVREYANAGQENEFLENLADHYADVIVYLNGFGADFKRFLASLANGWSVTYGDLADVVARYSIGQFLLRAYLIYEFDQVRLLQKRRATGKVAEFVDSPGTIQRLISGLTRILKKEHPDLMPFLGPADWALLLRNAQTRDFSEFHRALYAPFVQIPVTPMKNDLRAFERGEIVALNETHDINGLFGELAYRMVMRPKKRSHFRTMAALGKSAAIEFHRRQITRRERYERPSPVVGDVLEDPDLTPIIGASSKPRRPRQFVAGARFFHWELKERLGTGGMGEVWRAADLRTKGKDVALKFARSGAGASAKRQLTTELRLGHSLVHQNICQVYDYGETKDGEMYIVMEFVGEDLRRRIERLGRIPKDQGILLARDIFNGLAQLHEEEIVHRDLKPSNVLIDARDRAKISDCGLAILDDEDRRGFVGTWVYMAPEQFAGKRAIATLKSDIYSAGLVLFEIFTGTRAIEATTMDELAASHVAAQRRRPSSLVKGLASLDDLIMRCLADNPDHRPSAAELRDAWTKVARPKRKGTRR